MTLDEKVLNLQYVAPFKAWMGLVKNHGGPVEYRSIRVNPADYFFIGDIEDGYRVFYKFKSQSRQPLASEESEVAESSRGVIHGNPVRV